ncbi:MAG: replication-relaxation family protein [Myxococcales bacterium]|nr:replication-relaxation family protein [Myxococcales bacterium]
MKALRLGGRDYQLLALLAEARCMSFGQLCRLFFRGTDKSVARARLRKLCAGERAPLKRLEWYDREGVKYAWSLTPAGYVEAERFLETELDVPRDDIGAEYLDHHVLLTDLLVGLLAAPVDAAVAKLGASLKRRQDLGHVYARASHPSFTWCVVGDRDLPWKQPVGAKLEARLLRPDAFLELPGSRRRVFVESELGTHTIVAASASKTGATTAKMDRYEAFCTLVTGPTTRRSWYAERFPDGMKPEVLFLVRSAVRQASVQRAVDAWKRAHPTAVCSFRVGTVASALADLLPAVGHAVAPAPEVEPKTVPPGAVAAAPAVALSPADVKVLTNYFQSSQSDFKARRDRARAAGKQPPDYPVATGEFHALIERLRRHA